MKSGDRNFLETSRPLQACNRTALPYTYVFKVVCPSEFSSGNPVYAFLFAHIHDPFPANLILIDIISKIISGEECE